MNEWIILRNDDDVRWKKWKFLFSSFLCTSDLKLQFFIIALNWKLIDVPFLGATFYFSLSIPTNYNTKYSNNVWYNTVEFG